MVNKKPHLQFVAALVGLVIMGFFVDIGWRVGAGIVFALMLSMAVVDIVTRRRASHPRNGGHA
jgi:hypothetical protein